MKKRFLIASFFVCALAALTATAGAQALGINSNGIGVNSGAMDSYMNFGTGDGEEGYGFRDNDGLLEYKNKTADDWVPFSDFDIWKSNTVGFLDFIFPAVEETDSNPNAWVCIGNQLPDTLLHIYDFDLDLDLDDLQVGDVDNHKPQVYLFQDGAGDSSLAFRLDYESDTRLYFTLGIDQRWRDDQGFAELVSTDFKICRDFFSGGQVPGDLGDLDGEDYDSPHIMMRIHSEQATVQPGKQTFLDENIGIVDFNHQSRARVYMGGEEAVTKTFPNFWTPVQFGFTSWDEHGEMDPVSDCSSYNQVGIPCTQFVALEEGYYQVNSRVQFDLSGEIVHGGDQPARGSAGIPDSYISIAIFHNGQEMAEMMHSQGNNLQIINGALGVMIELQDAIYLRGNNAPNVSDIVHLKKGESIEIRVWQDTGGELDLMVPSLEEAWPVNYFSVHKIS